MVTIKFFGQLRERLDCEQLSLTVESACTVEEIKARLTERGERWQEWLEKGNVLVAVNHTMSNMDVIVNDGDELAFFPPVTGG